MVQNFGIGISIAVGIGILLSFFDPDHGSDSDLESASSNKPVTTGRIFQDSARPKALGSRVTEATVPPGIDRPRLPRFALDGRLMQIFTKTVENRVKIEISKGISH